MASITSSVSGSTVTFVITDQAGGTCTVVAPPVPAAVTYSSSGLLADGQELLSTLNLLLQTRGCMPTPQVMANTTASFTN